MRLGHSIVAVLLLSVLGCGRTEEGSGGGPVAPTKASLASRLAAAMSITSSSERDAALSALVQDAAKEGDVEIVLRAVQAIAASDERDEAASAAAVELARKGKGEDAVRVAHMILSVDRKNRTLSAIAKGE